MSDDGEYVFFQSPVALVGGALNDEVGGLGLIRWISMLSRMCMSGRLMGKGPCEYQPLVVSR